MTERGTTNTSNDANRPIVEFRDGAMKVAIWRNEPKEEGGRVRYDTKLTNSFKDAEGNWCPASVGTGIFLRGR